MNPTFKLVLVVGLPLVMAYQAVTLASAESADNDAAKGHDTKVIAIEDGKESVLSHSENVQVLEDLVVFRKGNLRGVIYEDDGSLSLSSNSDFEAFLALDSGPGAALNFTVSFAHGSATMTASGNRTLEMMADAMDFAGRDVAFEIIIHDTGDAHTNANPGLIKRRVSQLVSQLKRRHKLGNTITTTFSGRFKVLEVPTSPRAPQLLPLTIINNGAETP